MGAAGRGRDPHLIDALARKGRRYSFFQAVRLLRQTRRNSGKSADGVRFRTPASLTFPSTAVESIKVGGEAEVTVNVVGLTGPAGVLPHHYTHELIARAVDSDEAARAFFDLFNQRLIDLFYQGWERTKLHVRHERDDESGPARRLLAVAGLGTPGLAGALSDQPGGMTPNAAAYFAGLLGQTPRSARAIQQVLSDLLGVPVAVEQFVGVWLSLPRDQRTRLGGGGERPRASARLGGAVLGDTVWDRRSTLCVRIGPLDRGAFQTFLPDGDGPSPAFKALLATLSALLGASVRVQVKLVLKGDEVPGIRLAPAGQGASILGLSTWLAGRDPSRDAEDTLLA